MDSSEKAERPGKSRKQLVMGPELFYYPINSFVEMPTFLMKARDTNIFVSEKNDCD